MYLNISEEDALFKIFKYHRAAEINIEKTIKYKIKQY